jgi:hypothetical protein
VRRLAVFGAVALAGALLGTALVQLWANLTDEPYLTYQQLRMSKLVYPAVLASVPLAVGELWGRRRFRYRAAALLVGLASLVPSLSPRAMLYSIPEDWVAYARAATSKGKAGGSDVSADRGPEAEMWAWVRESTSTNALFFTDSLSFRVATLRSTTGTVKDAGMLDLAGTKPLLEWFVRMQRLQQCKAVGGEGCWFSLAQEAGADFVVVEPDTPKARPPNGFTRVWARDRWSVWRRDRT